MKDKLHKYLIPSGYYCIVSKEWEHDMCDFVKLQGTNAPFCHIIGKSLNYDDFGPIKIKSCLRITEK